MKKQLIAPILCFLLVMAFVPYSSVSAITISEIQNQINQLIDQINQLQQQINQLSGQQTPYNYQNYLNIPVGFSFNQDLSLGMNNQDVVYLKSILQSQGCYSSNYDSSQYFNYSTQSAVICFQNKYRDSISAYAGYSIRAQGFVGPATRTMLNSLINSTKNYYQYPTYYPPYSSELSASCSASPNNISFGQVGNFVASASGGTGSYTYSWSGICTGTGVNCNTGAFYNAGSYTAYLTVSSGGQSVSTNCQISVNSSNYSSISCYASPNPARINQTVNFYPSLPYGSGSYTYSWSGACNGSGSSCASSFPSFGTYTEYLTVYSSGQQVGQASCSAVVNSY